MVPSAVGEFDNIISNVNTSIYNNPVDDPHLQREVEQPNKVFHLM